MAETDLMDTLKSDTFLSKSKGKYLINVPVAKAEEDTPTASNVMILPFSLAEKAFTCGEAVIYREYASELDLGIKKSDDCRCIYPFIFQIRSTIVPLTENDTRYIDSIRTSHSF